MTARRWQILALALALALAHALAASPPSLAGARVVALNQAGYPRLFPKIFYSHQAADSFRVELVGTGAPVFRGPLALSKPLDPATGHAVYRGDFSAFQQSGRYRIVTSRGDTSAAFSISDSVYDEVYRAALRGFYFQRCGMPLISQFAGVYQHGTCHGLDGVYHASTDSSGFHLATGGWHDAGDYGKYVVNAGITAGTLLLAYEMFPEKFGGDDLGIPESGNGVPDILDEVRYELNWFLTMQRQDGGFWFKVTRPQFEGFVMPQNDTGPRNIYAVSSTATGDAVGVLAKGSRLFAQFDTAFARTCLNAANRGWQYLLAHPDIVPAGGFRNPAGTATGEYGDANDTDERLWAAAELFEATGESGVHDAFLGGLLYGSQFTGAPWWGNVRPFGLLTYLRSEQPAANAAVRSDLRASLAGYCASQVSRKNGSGYQTLLLPGDYNWGSNSSTLNAALLLLAGASETGDSSYAAAAADQLHYVLGANGLSRCFVTGIGEFSPRQPHHRPSASDGIPAPVPGLLAGGPDQYREDPLLQALYTSSTPPALCYVDSLPSYASNEIAINWNAPLVFVAGYFRGVSGPTGIGPAEPGRPSGLKLEQNFPNPFNGRTTIRFSIAGPEILRFRVVDLLGKRVAEQDLGSLPGGEHEVVWNATDALGRPLSSGVYFYSLIGRGHRDVRKLVLAR